MCRFRFLAVAAVLVFFAAGALAQPTTVAQETRRVERTTTIREETLTEVQERAETPAQEPRRAAVFVRNRAGEDLDEKTGALEDLLVAQIAGMGFELISRDEATRAVSTYLRAERLREESRVTSLEDALETKTSALRLARNLGADYIFVASIATYGQDSSTIDRGEIQRDIDRHQMRVTYKILSTVAGESLTGGAIVAEKTLQTSAGFTESSDVLNDLIAEASEKLAAVIREKGGTRAVPERRAEDGLASFSVSARVADYMFPEVVLDDQGQYIVTGNNLAVDALSVTIELDGLTIGSTPGTFQAAPGIHTLRLTREGFRPWERMINITEGLSLDVALQLDDEGLARWRDNAAFLTDLKAGQRLTDAQIELLNGLAQFFRQSGLRVDSTDVPDQVNIGDRTIMDSIINTP